MLLLAMVKNPIMCPINKMKPISLTSKMKKYQIIYADPPWEMQYLKETKEGFNVYDLPYKQMSNDKIMNLRIKNILNKDAILFLWCIDSRIPILSMLMDKWGFTYKTIGFVWNKVARNGFVNATIGKYTRKSCEFCYIGIKGKMLVKDHTFNQYIPCVKSFHSEKPYIVRDTIVKMCGDLPRIELFARKNKDELFEDTSFNGWDVWGNEVDSDIEL